MSSKKLKRALASVAAVAMLAGTSATPFMSVCAAEILGETSFDYKITPWRVFESSPARQYFTVEDGALHIHIFCGKGEDGEKWDLGVTHRNLTFFKGNTYHVSFKAKAKRNGMQLCSHICNPKGTEEYFTINEDKMQNGPHTTGGSWGKAAELTKEYQTFEGDFTPDKDIKGAEWKFEYANGTKYEGNAEQGDEIWFDDMSITCDDVLIDGESSYGATSRDWAAKTVDSDSYMPGGVLNNYISVNQLGYYPNLSKVAVLGDNQGDILYGSSEIELKKDTYEFEVCDAKTGKSVYSGISSKKQYDKDSGDNVCKLDFTEFNTPGEYYIKAGEWRSFPFKIADDIYSDNSHNMLTNALNYFYQNRSGIDIEEAYITSGDKSKLAHYGVHKQDVASVQKIWKNEYSSKSEATSTYASSTITASGGWYGAGDYGKSVVGGGISVWTLQNMYERATNTARGIKKFSDGSGTVVIPESGNDIPDILDEAAYELDWMTSMVVQPDEPTWGKYAGLVYHKMDDHKWTGLAVDPYYAPGYSPSARIVKPPTFAATLNYAACAAQAARLWKPYDAKKAAFYLDEAKKAYAAYEKYWYEPAIAEETKDDSLYGPSYLPNYEDSFEVRDDAYWAACEIFVSAKDMGDPVAGEYYEKLTSYYHAFNVPKRTVSSSSINCTYTAFNLGVTGSAGSLTLALHKDLFSDEQAKKIMDSIIDTADDYIKTEDLQGYGIPYLYDGVGYRVSEGNPENVFIQGYENGSNSMVINNAIVMAYAYDITKDDKYMNGVTTAMDYLLGTNPLSFSFITGYGTYHVKNPYHKYWAQELDDSLPAAPDGVLSGGPNTGLQDTYVRSLGFVSGKKDNHSQRCYVDSVESWSTNEVAMDWNSSLAWVVSFLQDENMPEPPVDPIDPPVTENTSFTTGKTSVTENTSVTTGKTSVTENTSVTTGKTSVTESISVTTGKTSVTENTSVTTGKTSVTENTSVTTDKSLVTSKAPVNDFKYGDIDGNEVVDITDLTYLSLYLLDDYKLKGNAVKAADVNADDKINLADLAHLKQFICKDDVVLGPQE